MTSVEAMLRARDLVGERVEVVVTSGMPYRGRLVGISDQPVLMLEDGQKRWMLSRAVIKEIRRDS